MLKEATPRDKTTKCGLVILPKTPILTTIWTSDVNCPMCHPLTSDQYMVWYRK